MKHLILMVLLASFSLIGQAQTTVKDSLTVDETEYLTKKEFKQYQSLMMKAFKNEHKGRTMMFIGGLSLVVLAAIVPEAAIAGAVVWVIGYFIDKNGVKRRYKETLRVLE